MRTGAPARTRTVDALVTGAAAAACALSGHAAVNAALLRTPTGRSTARPVSVLLPVRDEAPRVEACLRALLGQSGVDLEVVVVDDGTATIEFARLWSGDDELLRWHSTALSGARRRVAALARRRIGPRSGCRLSLFTAMPVQTDALPVVRNVFSWVRSQLPTPEVKAGGDLIGTSLVETGVVELAHYLRGVQRLAAGHSIDRYFAHRKESDDKLAQIARLGLRVVRPDLPLELVARREAIGSVLISFPSTVVHTLPLVLSDTRSRLLVCDIADDWYTAQAPQQSHRFLAQVSTAARDAHGLLSVAC